MAENVLIGADVFRFGPLELHGNLTKLDDSRELAVAIHRPLKRDGQKVERMGRMGHAFTATLYFVGRTWRADLLKFQKTVEDEPTRILVHPVYGRIKMLCQKVTSVVEPPGAGNLATVTAQFIENNVDTKLTGVAAEGVAARSQAVTAEIEDLTTIFALFSSASAAGATLTAAAESFRAAVDTAFQAGIPDASLLTKLAAVARYVEPAITALRADPLAFDDPSIFAGIQGCERLYDACQLLRDAFLEERPPLIEHAVAGLTSVFAIAGQFYGEDGLSRVEEILANNPDLLNPAAVPPGMVLKLATATV